MIERYVNVARTPESKSSISHIVEYLYRKEERNIYSHMLDHEIAMYQVGSELQALRTAQQGVISGK